MRVVVTGGAGFVGSSIALALRARHEGLDVVAFDNLYRRGSELNLPRLKAAGVRFVHGDVRHGSDLERLGSFDALVECSAEPSVVAAVSGEADFVFETNLAGAYRCLEAAARAQAQVVFLSTSRVYPLAALRRLATTETETRFEIDNEQDVVGASAEGIAERFPLDGARTLYGTTKLAAELLCAEYSESHGIPITIDRCGVIAGPWQMGKVDQGVFTHWVLAHHLGRDLAYIGFGGTGKQVRDLLHIDDLVDLVDDQLARPEHWRDRTFNVGGGRSCSLSLRETTQLCQEIVGRRVAVGSEPEDRAGDVPVYVTDHRAITAHSGWAPTRTREDVLADIASWIAQNERLVVEALA